VHRSTTASHAFLMLKAAAFLRRWCLRGWRRHTTGDLGVGADLNGPRPVSPGDSTTRWASRTASDRLDTSACRNSAKTVRPPSCVNRWHHSSATRAASASGYNALDHPPRHSAAC